MISHTGSLHTFFFSSLRWRMPDDRVYLTFDDGPHATATLKVLECLKKHGVPATFFLTGMNIKGKESIVKHIFAEGHSIGIHAFHHTRSIAFSMKRTKDEIETSEKLISSLVTLTTKLFRPPFGFFSWNTIRAARSLGYQLIMWSCLTGDFRTWSIEKIVKNSLQGLSGGSILVLHDNNLTQHKIVGILDELIPKIKSAGFEFGVIR